ncbi:MFS transporter [Streptomyces sp. NPDC056930]|uniref:MFS transporter n=1 Tax=Streptomyces sp. NPDC056930 TaxID=3345967 RepID=UPI003636AB7E
MAAVTFYNAFYLQGARGFSPIEAGLASLPTAIGALLGAPVGARLVHRWSLRLVSVPALTVAALTMGAYGLFGLRTPLVWIEILLFFQGLFIGTVIGPVTAALISALPLERAGTGLAVTQLRVPDKTNEITCFAALLEPFDLHGVGASASRR